MLVRPTARVLAFDPAGCVLRVRCDHDGRVFWIAPGGGVESGETFEAAARRELREETGIELAAVGPCVLAGDVVGRHPGHGERDILYRGRTFLARLTAADAARLDPGAVERAGYRTHRWWSLADLDRADEPVPEGLATTVRRVLAVSETDPFCG